MQSNSGEANNDRRARRDERERNRHSANVCRSPVVDFTIKSTCNFSAACSGDYALNGRRFNASPGGAQYRCL